MFPLNKRKMALLGGTGFIDCNIALPFKKCGADVSIVDSLQVNNLLACASSENQKNLKGIKIHYEARDSLVPDRRTVCVDKIKSPLGVECNQN